MVEVTLGFHTSMHVPSFGKGLEGTKLPAQSSWTVRQLCTAIESLARKNGFGLRVGALINPARGSAAPPHEEVDKNFMPGDRAVVLGDIRREPWPDAQANGSSRPVGSPVPITIFTGFLGAGKTTVLNHLLLGQRDKKFAVIENEFGEVPIDNELLQNSALDLAEQVVVMENGCMCCTVRGDLLGAFDAIRKQMDSGNPLDAVLIETTGMADPLPIVRTLRNTPDIAKYFRLDGTITLVDTKTILSRLSECAAGSEDQERHRQISFADKILLNKLDLVDEDQVAKVWKTIRTYSESAPVIPSVKGVVPPAELTDLGAFDMDKIVFEDEGGGGHGHNHGHDHGHDHGHGHGCNDDNCTEHGHGHNPDCSDDCHEDHGGGGHGHSHEHGANKHDKEIGSFSIVRKDVEVDALAFARWVRIIATLPEDKGSLYRSKGVLAAAGRTAKLVFHAVADVTETSDGPPWGDNEQRSCKIVFIGKKLDRKHIEERFLKLLQPVTPSRQLSPRNSPGSSLEMLCQRGLVHQALLGVWTRDVLRMSQTSLRMRDAVVSSTAMTMFQTATSSLPVGAPRGLHAPDGGLWLHGLLPVCSIKKYALAWRSCKTQMITPFSSDYITRLPLEFDTLGDAEAAGVMWMELEEIQDPDSSCFLTEFTWRPETMQSFFAVPGSSTSSSLVKLEVEDADGDSDMDDTLRFRVSLYPDDAEKEAGEHKERQKSEMRFHRMSLQLVGGKTSNHIYQIFFHTVDPTYQVHIAVPDHRIPIFPTKEVFHQWHPLMTGLKQRPRLRFLIRAKSMEKGSMEAMCGCCA